MLDLQAMRVSFAAIKVASCLCIIRVHVNVATGRLDIKDKNVSFGGIQTLFMFCMITKAGQLLYTIIFQALQISHNKGALDIVFFSAGVFVLLCMSLICSYELDKSLPTALVLFREFGLEKPSRILKKRKTVVVGSRWRRVLYKTKIMLMRSIVEGKCFLKQVSRLPKRNYLEVLVFVLPFCVFFIPAAWVLQTCINPTLDFFILSILPKYMQMNPVVTLVAICFETTISAFSGITLHFAFVNQVLAQLTIKEKVKAAFKSAMKIRPHLFRSKELVCCEVNASIVSTRLCNLVWSRVEFLEKQTALYCAITCTFYTLTRFRLSPVGVGAVWLGVIAIVFWLVARAKLFITTELMGSTRKELRLLVGQGLLLKDGIVTLNKTRLLIAKARIQALVPVGFSEGGFRYLHRESALEFIDFYICQVMFLLLTFS